MLVFQSTLDHSRTLLGEQYQMGGSLINSLIVATSATLLADDLWFWFISKRFMSPVAILLPVFLVASRLKGKTELAT